MRELSLNILDIARNGLEAGADQIEITIEVAKETLTISIKDNGKGMDKDKAQRVQDPFVTDRTSRKVGLGIPLFKMSALMTNGEFSLSSEPGKGTLVQAVYKLDNIDRAPLGAVEDTVIALIGERPDADYTLIYKGEADQFEFSTREIRAQLEEVEITNAEVLMFIKEYIANNIKIINKGAVI
jgi:anti-sigma regulatory factor (Ser/Thr protein kinase)